MATLKEDEVRTLFKAMHAKGASTKNVATTGRTNSAEPYNGDDFLGKFESMLGTNVEIAKGVFKKFGA